MQRCTCMECSPRGKETSRKGMHPYILPGLVLSTPWVEKEATKQAVQFRKNDVVKAGDRNKSFITDV